MFCFAVKTVLFSMVFMWVGMIVTYPIIYRNSCGSLRMPKLCVEPRSFESLIVDLPSFGLIGGGVVAFLWVVVFLTIGIKLLFDLFDYCCLSCGAQSAEKFTCSCGGLVVTEYDRIMEPETPRESRWDTLSSKLKAPDTPQIRKEMMLRRDQGLRYEFEESEFTDNVEDVSDMDSWGWWDMEKWQSVSKVRLPY